MDEGKKLQGPKSALRGSIRMSRIDIHIDISSRSQEKKGTKKRGCFAVCYISVI